ncbi:Vps54-domain-containing protein [Piromyces finnis]|uniref:Vacuolar protein sorting-associated protein 54 n=1 Tax=Piromyces finnis TaxID=1754191 RepID=A0A1Y1UY03_9FUNG|nr:Vps54-domain-containing protein [Piromyces finnis]|eukprot:ORX42131.1 Vps54-domain-containing protein [Piromyces finnis]
MDLFTAIANEEKEWTVNDIGRNSISEIHNNPNDPNKLLNNQKQINYDSPVIPTTTIRKVKKTEFQKYSTSISDEYEIYNENLHRKVENPKKDKGKETDDVTSQLKSIIPEIFFQQDFNLENPIIFNQVCENVNISSDVIFDMEANNILQEQLSNYLDIVEINLMSEISKKRESFFSALSSLKTLYKEIDDCVDEIKNLKIQLNDVSKYETQKGLEVVSMKNQRVNLENLYNGIRLLSEVRQTQPTIQILLGQNDYIGALDLIEETNNALRGYNYQSSNGTGNINNMNKNNKFTLNNSPTTLRSPISILSSNTYANSNYSFPLDLRGVKGLKNINSQLIEMSKAIEMMMQNEFVQVLMDDIYNVHNYKSKKSSNSSDLQKESSTNSLFSDTDDKPLIIIRTLINDNIDEIPNTEELVIDEEMLYTKLSPLIFGLLRTNKFLAAFLSFKNEIQEKFTDIIKKKFSSLYEVPPDIAAKLKSENITEETMALNKIKNLSFEEYYALLDKYYLYILSLIRRISIIKCLINDIIEQAEKKNITIGTIKEESQVIANNQDSLHINTDKNTLESDYKTKYKSNQDYNRIKKEFITLVNQIVDVFYGNCSRMLTIRSEKNSQLSSINFNRLYSINIEFINASEKLTKRSYLTLKSNILSQAKTYINSFHNKKIKQMVNDIETDQWVPAEITENNQEVINRITQNEWSSIAELSTIGSLTASTSSSQKSSIELINKNSKKIINRSLFIEKKKYIVAACTLTFINTLSEYIGCAETIPILTIDIINSIYSLLQVFNSKVCQIIIGGGAVTSGGLKYIAAKHLALASRSLGAVRALIPYIKNFLQSKLLAKQLVLLNDLDRYSKDYENHQDEIYDKLISIMNGKLESHCKSFQGMDWELPEVPTQPNVYMLLMVKDLTSLYRLLSKIIPIEVLQQIMKEVLTSYSTRLERELGNIEIYSSNAKNRLLIDFQYYIQKLSLLDGIDGPGNRLEVVVNNITIKEKMPTLEQKAIINEYIRQSFDSGSRRSSIYDENSSSYSNSSLIVGKNDEGLLESEKLSNSPLNIGNNSNEEYERVSVDNISQDELNLDNGNEIITTQNIENLGNNNNNSDYISSSHNQSISFNSNKDESSDYDNSNTNTVMNNENYQLNIDNDNNNNNSSDNNNDRNNNNNGVDEQGMVISALNSSGYGNGESSYFNKRHNSVPNNNYYSSNIDPTGSSMYDRKNSYSEERNQNFVERKNSYTINKNTFSVLSKNVKKFGSEIKKHYHSNNNSMEALFGLDKTISKSNSTKSLPSDSHMLENE